MDNGIQESLKDKIHSQPLSGSRSFTDVDDSGRIHRGSQYNENDSDIISVKMEKLTFQLKQLAQLIQSGSMSQKDKEVSKGMLNQIVQNIFEQKVQVQDEWANLEEIE